MQHELSSNKNLKLIKRFNVQLLKRTENMSTIKKRTTVCLQIKIIMKKRDHEVHSIRTASVFEFKEK